MDGFGLCILGLIAGWTFSTVGGFEGDIILTTEQSVRQDDRDGDGPLMKRNAHPNITKKWPNGELVYEFFEDQAASHRGRIRRVMGYISNVTGGCIKFTPFDGNTTKYPNRVVFQRAKGTSLSSVNTSIQKYYMCGSNVGRADTPTQPIYYSSYCLSKVGAIAHEVIHALGFWHEHTRPDRDNYIRINFTNIREGMEADFAKTNASEFEDYGTKYDYDSVMHYPHNAFAKDYRYSTIIQLHDRDKYTIGQRDHVSKGDVIKLKKHYHCV